MIQGLLLLLVPTLAFRGLGALGVARFASWRDSAAHGLAVMLALTGAAHFTPDSLTVMPSHDDLTAMVPSFVPVPDAVVYLTGILELLGAAGLVLPATRRAAGVCLALLFVCLLPANVSAAVHDVPLNGEPATPLWFRVPEQALYIAVALWAARAPAARRAGRPAAA
ncbi:DoxX family protein [Dactylosporangium sp. AC04546]|uniref:DoxX family protein n=1 Tax=Dactylosporangium sp. AC04546 TaxID=2862460 RepID=UPI001EE1536C|nr:DoxX family protein [Dactylosporangium sp. AC04546]WVK78729.1 DoxX family protein [Dactylosporangium sp. AC04546]